MTHRSVWPVAMGNDWVTIAAGTYESGPSEDQSCYLSPIICACAVAERHPGMYLALLMVVCQHH